MAIAYVDSNSNYAASVTYTIQTAGNLLVFAVKHTSAISNVADTKTNSWSLAKYHDGSGSDVSIYYAVANGTGSTTITYSGGGDTGCAVAEYSGVDTLDKTAEGQSAGVTVTSGSFTPTVADELIVAACGMNGATGTWTAGDGYDEREEQPDCSLTLIDQIISSVTSYTASATSSAAGTGTNIAVATFQYGTADADITPSGGSLAASGSVPIQGHGVVVPSAVYQG